MRVFLGNPPWKKEGYFGVRAGSRWPHFERDDMEYMPFPFFLSYATAVIENAGFPVMLIDAIAEDITREEFLRRMVAFAPDIVLFEVSTSSIDNDFETVAELRKLLPRTTKVAFAGLHALMYNEQFLIDNPDVDYVLIGEYEYALRDLAQHLAGNADALAMSDIDGIIYRTASGVKKQNKRRSVENLDELPWPARHFLPMYKYRDEPGNLERPSVQIWTTRGCPYKCTFCAWPQIMYGDNAHRLRSIKNVVDEVEWLVQAYNFKSFYIDDDTFNVKRERVAEFCDELIRRRLDIPWGAMTRADLMDAELLQLLKRSGLHSVKYGVESANQQILNNARKNMNIEKTIEAIRYTKAIGIKIHLTFMFGLPGETRATAQDTLDLALDLHPESLQFTLATPFPGSALFENLSKENKIESLDFAKYDGFHSSVIRTDAMSREELEAFTQHANREWQKVRYGVVAAA